ncbi:MAG: glucose-1-phosphate adenylyltransferase subunit GlgD [Ruminococcus sp.]|jgi:glucose-1-phosphate adenylyltransferase|nr:glucose-1-phosphate adenylyltransferase subunit GlgD [Ruminococcus sp.]
MNSNKKVLGLIFSNLHDENISDLTENRTMGSVLFGARYRLIDFPLSSMVNSGIEEVGVITKSNYQSLLDHLGNGREWDLSRKNGGLHLLPPFSHSSSGMYRGRLEALYGVWDFIKTSEAEYVLFSDCDVIANMDYAEIIEEHIQSKADITCVYGKENVSADMCQGTDSFGINADGRIVDVLIKPHITGETNVSLNTYVMKKDFLKMIVDDSMSRSDKDFERSVLQARCADYLIMGYCFDGYFSRICSKQSYMRANFDLLKSENRHRLFPDGRPIYTKIRDNPPAKYAIGAKVKNSLIGDGCIVDGEVTDSILFRGAKVAAGAVVKNCIIMQDTIIEKGSTLQNVITDKNVKITAGHLLTGSEKYPLFIGKGAEI